MAAATRTVSGGATTGGGVRPPVAGVALVAGRGVALEPARAAVLAEVPLAPVGSRAGAAAPEAAPRRIGRRAVSAMTASPVVRSSVLMIGVPNPARGALTTVVRAVPAVRVVSGGKADSAVPAAARAARVVSGGMGARRVPVALVAAKGKASVRAVARGVKGVRVVLPPAVAKGSGGSRDAPRRNAGSRTGTTVAGGTSGVRAGAGSKASVRDVQVTVASRSRDVGRSARRTAVDAPMGRRVTVRTGADGPKSANVPRRSTTTRSCRRTSPARNWTRTRASSCARCRKSWPRRSPVIS